MVKRMNDELFLRNFAAECRSELDERGAAALVKYLELLLETNKQFNLTAITDRGDALNKHFADCLAAAALPQCTGRVADVGTGAGFPAVVIKALKPDTAVTAIDSTEKKLNFVREASRECGIPVETKHIRAEDAGRSELRGAFDCVTARAVAALPKLAEYCLPLVKKGGYFIAMKGASAGEELEDAKKAIAVLGGEVAGVEPLTLPDGSQRINIIIKKTSSTPREYPRRQKDIKERPL